LPPETRTGATRDLTKAFYLPQRDPRPGSGGKGQLRLVATVGDLENGHVNLWTARAGDRTLDGARPLPFNSQGMIGTRA